MVVSNLAVVYDAQKKYALADSVYRVVAAARATILGTQHPDYLSTIVNMGVLYL